MRTRLHAADCGDIISPPWSTMAPASGCSDAGVPPRDCSGICRYSAVGVVSSSFAPERAAFLSQLTSSTWLLPPPIAPPRFRAASVTRLMAGRRCARVIPALSGLTEVLCSVRSGGSVRRSSAANLSGTATLARTRPSISAALPRPISRNRSVECGDHIRVGQLVRSRRSRPVRRQHLVVMR